MLGEGSAVGVTGQGSLGSPWKNGAGMESMHFEKTMFQGVIALLVPKQVNPGTQCSFLRLKLFTDRIWGYY